MPLVVALFRLDFNYQFPSMLTAVGVLPPTPRASRWVTQRKCRVLEDKCIPFNVFVFFFDNKFMITDDSFSNLLTNKQLNK